MEGLGLAASGVAHDFNNALTTILGTAELLAEHADEAAKQDLACISQATEHAAGLTRQLLMFAKQDFMGAHTVELSDAVQRACELAGRTMPPGVELVKELASDPIVLVADATQLQQVVLNLLLNARDATDKGSIVVVTRREAESAVLSVEDSGNGIVSVGRRWLDPLGSGAAPRWRLFFRRMFIGHFALGFAAKRFAPGVSLAGAFVACQFLDLLWPALVLAKVEDVSVDVNATAFTPLYFYYPWSHSLLMTLIYAACGFALATRAGWGSRAAGVVAFLVTSHWLLDFVSHRPDMPLAPFVPLKVGVGLWNSIPLTIISEGCLFVGSVWLYARSTRPKNKRGVWALWTLVAFLTLMYVGNAFGPKPEPGVPARVIAGPALAMWILVLWAYWVDQHRVSRATEPVAHPLAER